MKIYVMVDMEGISGIYSSSQVKHDDARFQAGRKYTTWDVNACVEGCLQGGAKKVVVADVHGGSRAFIWEELDPRSEYVQGQTRERIPGIAAYDGLILLGYHAMAGTRSAILEHTMSSKSWQHLWINGQKAGELAIDAGIAGDHGVPTIMTSGDDKLCREARRTVKGIVAVQVKKGLDCEGGLMLPKERAHKLITDGAAKAVRLCKQIKPYRVKAPVKMRVELVSRQRLPIPMGRHRGARLIDGRTYEVTGKNVEDAWRAL